MDEKDFESTLNETTEPSANEPTADEAAEMKSQADEIVENAAATEEAEEAAAEEAAEKASAEAAQEAAVAAAAVEGAEEASTDNTVVIDAEEVTEGTDAEAAEPSLDDTQSLDAVEHAAFGESSADDTIAEGTEESEEVHEGFDASNPQYDEHVQPRSYGSYDGPSYPGSYGQAAAQVQRGFITKRAFVLVLIIAMLLTMLASVGITTAYTTYMTGKIKAASADDHATNYTLTTSDESLSYKSIIEKTQDSVVSITTESVTNDIWMQNYVTQGAGSGVIIQSDGYIITCEHVIEGARKVTVTTRDGKEYPAEIVGADAANDIAVIKIDATGLKAATYGDSSKLEVGDTTVVIGNPLGTLSGTVTTGIISALDRKLTIDNKTMNLLQTDASINPGNSGGGMFDASGNLIGIVEAKSTGSDIDGLGFATPINKAAKIAKDLIKNQSSNSGKDSKGSKNEKVLIGVTVTEVSDDIASQYGYAHGGLLIRSVTSPQAQMAGLLEGDIIYQAEGKKVANMDDLSNILSGKKAGDKIKVSVARENGRTEELTTVLISSTQNY